MKLTFDQAAEALVTHSYRFAKTMPDQPHWYTLRRQWNEPTPYPIAFEDVFDYVTDPANYYREFYRRYWTNKVDINEFKYWTCGEPIGRCTLINRALIERVERYDVLASTYDRPWSAPDGVAETDRIMDALMYTGGSVLDVGCGTGRFLDWNALDPGYVGIDPSSGMLDQMRKKHPDAKTVMTRLETFWSPNKFDNIIVLGDTADMVSPKGLARLPGMLAPGGKLFVMFRTGGVRFDATVFDADFQPQDHTYCRLPGERYPLGDFEVLQWRAP